MQNRKSEIQKKDIQYKILNKDLYNNKTKYKAKNRVIENQKTLNCKSEKI